MPPKTSEEERVQRCIEHQKFEIVARNETGKMDFFIPGIYDRRDWQRRLFIIDKQIEEWGQVEGPFLDVEYHLAQRERDEDDRPGETRCQRLWGMAGLEARLDEFKGKCQ